MSKKENIEFIFMDFDLELNGKFFMILICPGKIVPGQYDCKIS